MRALYESEGNGGVLMRSSAHETSPSGDLTDPLAAFRNSNFWVPARKAAKFMRPSIAPLVNQLSPRSHPDTSGGSKSCCPIVINGFSASLTENPAQPISLIERTTNSAGHEY